ncbi:sulfate transporter, partial [bacterium]|nr:sulfate transporter [bacterium]
DGLSHGSRVQIDASASDYIDPDVLSLIRDFQNNVAPDRKILINLKGFSRFPAFEDVMQFPDYSTSETQLQLTQEEVLEVLAEGNQRFVEDRRLNRDLIRQVRSTADGQSPVAAILSCIDSRVPAEIVFDLGVGDIFSLRVAGNVVGTKSLGSLEYAVKVAGVKVVLVLGHTRCGAVTASAEFVAAEKTVSEETGCQNLQAIVNEIKPCVDSELASDRSRFFDQTGEVVSIEEPLVDEIAERNVIRSVQEIVRRSDAIAQSVRDGEIVIRGAIYDVKTGRVEFLGDGSSSES